MDIRNPEKSYNRLCSMFRKLKRTLHFTMNMEYRAWKMLHMSSTQYYMSAKTMNNQIPQQRVEPG